MSHDGTGGHTGLVDGFHIAKEFMNRDGQAYDLLCKRAVPAEYIDPGKAHNYAVSPVFFHSFRHGELERVR